MFYVGCNKAKTWETCVFGKIMQDERGENERKNIKV